ncbi:hypothetical protein HZA42_01590 [Candidatus Peregrinibacteria bacterium]|nr:hypothetical protein [Candidatus Peregrinibacteria bacterium]
MKRIEGKTIAAVAVLEDIVLGYLARERDAKSKDSDYLPEEEILKKLAVSLFCVDDESPISR